jgi:hypothetical protein
VQGGPQPLKTYNGARKAPTSPRSRSRSSRATLAPPRELPQWHAIRPAAEQRHATLLQRSQPSGSSDDGAPGGPRVGPMKLGASPGSGKPRLGAGPAGGNQAFSGDGLPYLPPVTASAAPWRGMAWHGDGSTRGGWSSPGATWSSRAPGRFWPLDAPALPGACWPRRDGAEHVASLARRPGASAPGRFCVGAMRAPATPELSSEREQAKSNDSHQEQRSRCRRRY